MTENIHAIGIGLILLLNPLERRVEELEIAITNLAGRLLPSVSRALSIGYAFDSRNALHIDDHGFRPQLVNAKPASGILSSPAVPVKHKDNRSARGTCRFRIRKNDCLPFHAVDSKAFRLRLPKRKHAHSEEQSEDRNRCNPHMIEAGVLIASADLKVVGS